MHVRGRTIRSSVRGLKASGPVEGHGRGGPRQPIRSQGWCRASLARAGDELSPGVQHTDRTRSIRRGPSVRPARYPAGAYNQMKNPLFFTISNHLQPSPEHANKARTANIRPRSLHHRSISSLIAAISSIFDFQTIKNEAVPATAWAWMSGFAVLLRRPEPSPSLACHAGNTAPRAGASRKHTRQILN